MMLASGVACWCVDIPGQVLEEVIVTSSVVCH